MKQTILFFIFIFSFLGYGQQSVEIQTPPPPPADTRVYIDCETGFYNLVEHMENQNLPSTGYTYNYFESLANAQNNTNPISNLTAYAPPAGQTMLYSRILNLITGGVVVSSYEITPRLTDGGLGGSLDYPQSYVFVSFSGGKGPFTYRWYADGVAIEGEEEGSLLLCGYSSNFISCVVTDSLGCSLVADAIVTQPESALLINDDVYLYTNVAFGLVSSASVIDNDTYNGLPLKAVTNESFTLQTVGSGWDNFTLLADGRISTQQETTAGAYTLSYTVIKDSDSTNLGTGTITVNVTNNGTILTGFIDINQNGTKESNEPIYGRGYFGNVIGLSSMNVMIPVQKEQSTIKELQTGINDLSYANLCAPASEISCSTFYEDVVIDYTLPTQEFLFPLNAPLPNDVSVTTFPIQATPGFTRTYTLKVRNTSYTDLSNVIVNFYKPAQSTIVTYPTGATPTAFGFTLTLSSLESYSQQLISGTLQFFTIPEVVLEEPFEMSAIVVSENDPFTDNNTSVFEGIFIGSYDPNDITEAHGPEIDIDDFSENDYLTYTIRFENTGNGAAQNVRIENLLPQGLNASTLQVVASSHSYMKSLVGNKLIYKFNNINLPPSNGSETVGNGFVTYRVKPSAGFTVGTEIQDTAEIYFDFNPAIITPSWNTKFVEQLSVPKKEKLVQFYTNPVTDVFELTLVNNQANAFATVYDLKGSLLAKAETVNGKLQIETQNWMSGIYVLKLQVGEKLENIKLIKL